LTASAAAKKTPRRRPTIAAKPTAGIRRYYGVSGCRPLMLYRRVDRGPV